VKLEKYIESNFRQEKSNYLNRVHTDILQRASSFLLLKDSKASFSIEGENPRNNRAARWVIAIGQAGKNELSIAELNRLQQLVIIFLSKLCLIGIIVIDYLEYF
jgi:uncharacterized protein with gpF-like domain